MFLLLQFRLCLISSCSPVVWLENVLVDIIRRQQRFLVVMRQALQPVSLGGFFGRIFLPLERCTCPSIFLRFLFRRYATTGLSVKEGARSLWVWSICQWLLMIFCMCGRWWLNVVENGVRLLGLFCLSCRSVSRWTPSAFWNCALVVFLG